MLPFEAADPLINRMLDQRYRVLSKLGAGGMGAVYKAQNKHVPERMYALKVILEQHAKDPEYRLRFLREAQALMRARHPHIVDAYDVHETSDGLLFLVMEFLTGQSADVTLRQNASAALPLSQALHIVDQVAEALHHAHGLNIIHRDIKPANILLVQQESDPNFVKVLDFGLARLLDQAAITAPLAGLIVGTPEYLAPEVFRGGDYLKPAIDVYALGCTLVELLTGSVPFNAPDIDTLRQAHQKRVPPRLAELRTDLRFPRDVEDLVRGMLAKERNDRPTLPQLRAHIAQLLDKLPKRTAQSMMVASTVLYVAPDLQERATQLKGDAKVRRVDNLLRELEKVEEERGRASGSVSTSLDRLLKSPPQAAWPADVASLRQQLEGFYNEEDRLRKAVADGRQKRLRERERIDARRSELHELIVKVRADIRALPAQNTDEIERDEKVLADLEQRFFRIQPQSLLAEQVAQWTLEQQRVQNRVCLCLHQLGLALVAALRTQASAQPLQSSISTDLEALDWGLDLLGRCNQNVEALMEDLPELQ